MMPTKLQQYWIDCVNDLKHGSGATTMASELPFPQYVGEYRTYILRHPRRSGKTTFFQHFNTYTPNSLLIVPTLSDAEDYKSHGINAVTSAALQHQHSTLAGKTVDHVFLDEVKWESSLMDVILPHIKNHSDFFVFGLYT